MKKAAKLIEDKEGNNGIAKSVGDNNANGHFFSGSGLSTLRMGVERTLAAVRKYNSNDEEINSYEKLVEKVNAIQKVVQDATLKEGSPFVDPL